MIKSWNHKGLEKFFRTGSKAGIIAVHAERLREQLFLLNTVTSAEQMNFPGYRLHKLIGDRDCFWSITVSGNWRITFKFEGTDAFIVGYEDYH